MQTGFFAAFALLALPLAAGTADEFFAAIRNNDTAKVRTLLADPSNLKLADSKGVTPLLYASAFGTYDTMKLLVDAGADVNAKDLQDDAPLHWSGCDPARVKLLVDHGADVNVKTKGGRTPLVIASGCEAAAGAVRLLLDKGADVNAQPADGMTPLMEAAQSGGPRIVRMVLAAGAKADAVAQGGFTTLMNAVSYDDVDLVQALIAKGAPVNAKNTFSGKVRNGDIDLKSLTALMLAAPYASPGLIKALLDAGADVKAKDARGMTPLMFAVGSDNQNVNVARLLIERGSEVNAISKTGETVLDWARKFQSPPVIALLEKAGAKGNPVPAAPARKEAPLRDPREAAAKSVSLLQKNSQEFFKQSVMAG